MIVNVNIQHSTTTINKTNSNTDIKSTHEPNSYAIHISISNQFKSKIDEVDLRLYYLFKGNNTIEHFIICLLDIPAKL